MLLLDQTGVIDDLWPRFSADAPLPERGRALVDLDRLGEALDTPLELGVHIPNDTDPATLAPQFGRLAMISVAFPSFADGRGFSIGQGLRARGFLGRLRASGPVISDQFPFLLQTGFDEVALPDSVASRQPVEHWLGQRPRVSLSYQRGLAGRGSILDARRVAGGRDA
jgi:uncharacterized protein (DUF934 family)